MDPSKRRKSSIDIIRQETKNWAATHPVGPILPLFFDLLWILCQNGVQWYFRAISLVLFIGVLLPGFLQVFFDYVTASDIERNIRFGINPRNFLDVYVPAPTRSSKKHPVLIFVSGGVWTIGYKAWGAFFGRILAAQGILVIMPDYRNFPQGRVQHMLQDIDAALTWVTNNVERYGGDKYRMHLMGQSAGAHLAAMTLLFKAREETEISLGRSENDPFRMCDRVLHPGHSTYKLSQIRSYIGVSGPYDLVKLAPHFHRKGLHLPMLAAIMGGESQLKELSPAHLVETEVYKQHELVVRFPRILLLHGSADKCVPVELALDFATSLNKSGYKVQMKLYNGKSHTDPIIEDLMFAEQDSSNDMISDIAHFVYFDTVPEGTSQLSEHQSNEYDSPLKETCSPMEISPSVVLESAKSNIPLPEVKRRSLVPKIMINFARFINPF